MKLADYTGINEYAFKFVEGKSSLYSPIYSLSSVELEALIMYIQTYLKTGFIYRSKFLAGASILCDKKSAGSLCLCIYYEVL